ncbi:MAG: MFS transporter, partial [Pseudomonadota bacterium]
MARWFVATRGRALSVASLGISVGEAFLPLIFVAAMAVIDWRVLWVVAAAIALLGVPLLGTLLRQERTPQSVSEAYAATGMFGQHWTRKSVITHPLFWMLVPMMLGPSAFNTAFFFHQVHLAELKGWEHVDLVALFPLYTAVSICAMIVSGWALDRYGAARLMPGFLLPLVVAFLIFSGATTTTAAALGLAVFGLSTGAMSTLPNAFWAEVYGTGHIGAIKSMVAAVMVFGSAIGPGITGYLIDLGIGLEVQFLWIAGYFVLASLMMAAGITWARRDLITD